MTEHRRVQGDPRLGFRTPSQQVADAEATIEDMANDLHYTVVEHAEWAGNDAGIDQDFEVETLEEARRVAREVSAGGSYYEIYDPYGMLVEGNV